MVKKETIFSFFKQFITNQGVVLHSDVYIIKPEKLDQFCEELSEHINKTLGG